MPNDLSLSLQARLALEKAGFRFTRSLGQNFLFDEELLERIARTGGADEGAPVELVFGHFEEDGLQAEAGVLEGSVEASAALGVGDLLLQRAAEAPQVVREARGLPGRLPPAEVGGGALADVEDALRDVNRLAELAGL